MYSKNILILGCGNIGSRHLQALTKLPYNLEIDIIEPNSDSKDIAKSRLNQSNFDSKKHKISWFDTVDESLQSYDLAIISTPSPRRVENIIKLLEMGIKQFLIEKIVCQSDAEYESLLSNLEKYDAIIPCGIRDRGITNLKKIKDQNYAKLSDKLIERRIKDPSISDVSSLVKEIRESKLPNYNQLGNAGSFFKNPVLKKKNLFLRNFFKL